METERSDTRTNSGLEFSMPIEGVEGLLQEIAYACKFDFSPQLMPNEIEPYELGTNANWRTVQNSPKPRVTYRLNVTWSVYQSFAA